MSAGARHETEVLQVIEEVSVVVCVAAATGRGSGLNDKCLVLQGDESPAEVITGIGEQNTPPVAPTLGKPSRKLLRTRFTLGHF